MDSQLVTLVVAAAIGFVIYIVFRSMFKLVSTLLTLVILAVIAFIAYSLLQDQIAALLGGA